MVAVDEFDINDRGEGPFPDFNDLALIRVRKLKFFLEYKLFLMIFEDEGDDVGVVALHVDEVDEGWGCQLEGKDEEIIQYGHIPFLTTFL